MTKCPSIWLIGVTADYSYNLAMLFSSSRTDDVFRYPVKGLPHFLIVYNANQAAFPQALPLHWTQIQVLSNLFP